MLADWYIRRTLRMSPPQVGRIASVSALRQLAQAEQVIIPTATLLYEGVPVVRQFFAVQDQTLATKQRVLQLAASLAAGSEQEMLKAVVQAGLDIGEQLREVETDSIAEIGVTGKLDRTWYFLGDEDCMQQEQIELGVTIQTLAQQFELDGKYTLFLAQKQPKRLLGIFACEYELHTPSVEALAQLQKRGLDIVLLTSTKTRIARGVADRAGITLVHSELDQQEKKRVVSALCKQRASTLILSEYGMAFGKVGQYVMVGSDGEVSVPELAELPSLLDYAQHVVQRTRKLFFWSS